MADISIRFKQANAGAKAGPSWEVTDTVVPRVGDTVVYASLAYEVLEVVWSYMAGIDRAVGVEVAVRQQPLGRNRTW